MLFKIHHADHGISQRQMGLVKDVIGERLTGLNGFFIQQITIPEEMGPVPCGLYGPAMGDDPQSPETDGVAMLHRPDRDWPDRVVEKPLRPVDYVQAIGIIDGEECVLFTVYGGPLAPQNPKDPSCQDVEEAIEWWSKHALSWTEQDMIDLAVKLSPIKMSLVE